MDRLSIHRHFAKLQDPRRVRRRCRHRFVGIIVIAICAVIANCDDWQEIEVYARARRNCFRRLLPLPHVSQRLSGRVRPGAGVLGGRRIHSGLSHRRVVAHRPLSEAFARPRMTKPCRL
jgi:hypothetical protein